MGSTSAFSKNTKRLLDFRAAKANWNGYGAEPIDQRSIENALAILSKEDIIQPIVSPLTDGGVQLSWCSRERELEVEVYPSVFNWYIDEQNEGSAKSIADLLTVYYEWVAKQV